MTKVDVLRRLPEKKENKKEQPCIAEIRKFIVRQKNISTGIGDNKKTV